MDHTRISGTEPSSVILSQTGSLNSWKVVTKKCLKTSRSQKGWCNKPTKLQFQSIFNTENCDALQTLRINRRTWLHVPSGTHWSTCSAGTLRHSTKHDVLKIPRNVKWRHYDVITMTPYYYRYRLLIAGIGSNFRLNLFYVLTTTTFCCVYQNNYVYQFWSKITAR